MFTDPIISDGFEKRFWPYCELRASLVSPGIIREGRRNPRRHSHSANLLKMRQVYNWLYLAGLIAILCINFSFQEPDQNSALGTCFNSLTKVVEFHKDVLKYGFFKKSLRKDATLTS